MMIFEGLLMLGSAEAACARSRYRTGYYYTQPDDGNGTHVLVRVNNYHGISTRKRGNKCFECGSLHFGSVFDATDLSQLGMECP